MIAYAGIGSRKTPPDIIKVMEDFAHAVAPASILRSGGAPGADVAFEYGATLGGGRREIYLPWKGFNGCLDGELLEPSPQAFEIAEHYHPGWPYLKQAVRKLIARNTHQVLGTGQALRIAADRDILVWNLQRPDHLEAIKEAIADGGIELA